MNTTPAGDALQEALALHRKGEHELAMKGYVALLQKNPGNVDALYYIAMIALQQGQLGEGIKVIEHAIAVSPRQGRLHNLKGQAQLRMNEDDAALQSFGRAIEADPSFADAYGNRATLLCEMERAAEAVPDFDRALQLRPNNPEDHCNRAGALADLGRFDEALAGFSRAIALMPGMAPAYFNRADVLRRLGRLQEALRDYDRMIELYPEHPAAHSNRGLILKELGRLDEARASIEHALKLDPAFTEALTNRANVALQQARFDDAKADYQAALKAQPELAEAEHGLALICLIKGEWEAGFKHYEARANLKDPAFKPLPYPRWTADTPASKRLLLLCEQGLGDTIQFSRFAPVFAGRGHDVTVLGPPPMQRLLSTLQGVTVAGIDDAPPDDGTVCWLPLMSTPGALGVRPDHMVARVPYLSAEPALVERWADWLGGQGFTIGINWGLGVTREWFGRRREIPLQAFAPLADIPGVRLISLQKGPPSQQIAAAPFGSRIEVPDTDPDPAAGNFVDTAALMMKLDLVVCCDTSLVHLAGGLGRPVFTAVPFVPDWRWLQDHGDTPWYPAMRLFRQTAPQDWSEVFVKIAGAVAELASAKQR
jgi:tetratricopeptide (TPR) repeat protein